MYQFETDEILGKLAEVKSVAIGVSRAIDKLGGKRGGKAAKASPGDLLVKSAVAELLRPMKTTANGVVYEKSGADMARSLYAGDETLQDWIRRAAVSPASTTTTGNALELMQTATVDFLTGGDAPSGFAQLAAQTLSVPVGSVKVPSRVWPFALAGSWVSEGSPKPVFTIPLTSISMTPSKLVAITAWSEEIANYSIPSIELLVADSLRHDIGALLDTAAFDTTAASATRPAGLFNGATSVTASATGTVSEKMAADLAALGSAVSSNSPGARVVYVMNPAQALRLTLTAPGFAVISSGFMAAGSVGALDAGSIVTMVGALQFLASSNATLHMDGAPSALSTAGSPNVISAPVSSAFQMDLVALRSVLFASWAKRRTGATALATSVTW